jgi:hypothetical protein
LDINIYQKPITVSGIGIAKGSMLCFSYYHMYKHLKQGAIMCTVCSPFFIVGCLKAKSLSSSKWTETLEIQHFLAAATGWPYDNSVELSLEDWFILVLGMPLVPGEA